MKDGAGDSRAAEAFAFAASRGFAGWLTNAGGAIAATTYQAGKLLLISAKPSGGLTVFERTFARCMGLAISADARSLLLATHYQILRFDNALPAGHTHDGHDALYAPRLSWITGDLDIHDVAFGTDGRPVFVNTLFNCLAQASDGWSFRPLWRPPFISKLAPEDRCHLNGMAMENGDPRFVSAVARSDEAGGWRAGRGDSGVIIDVTSNAIVCEGLSMPHSPRLRDGRLWLLNSGTGELGSIDTASGTFAALAFCPGYARGLAFAGGQAIVGLSLSREDGAFSGLALERTLEKKGMQARCGINIIDMRSGETMEWLRFEGAVRELYDVAFLPGVRNPAVIGFKSDEITRVIAIDER